MTDRIGPKRPFRIFLAEWRKHRKLTQAQLAGRISTDSGTISRWERYAREGEQIRGDSRRKLDTERLALLADALDCTPPDLYRHPDRPSADELIRNWPPERQALAFDTLRAWDKKAS